MADIRSVTILPSQPVQNVQQAQLSQGAPSQPLALNLPAGTVLNGFIVNRDASGNPILRTPGGDVTFASNFFLKIGSEVTIRVETTGGNTQAHILTVDGQPPEIAQNVSAFAGEPDVILTQQFGTTPSAQANATANTLAAPATEPVTTLNNTTITGTIIAQPAETTTTAPLAVGSQIALKIVSINAPANTLPPEVVAAAPTAGATTQSYVPAPATNSAYATYARAVSAPATPASVTTAPEVQTVLPAATATAAPTPAVPIAAQTSVAIIPAANEPQPPALSNAPASQPTPTITAEAVAPPENVSPSAAASPLSALLPTTPAPAESVVQNAATLPGPAVVTPATPIQPGQTFSARVIGNETTGEALVQTPVGVIRLEPGTVVPPGSTITFEMVQTTPLAPFTNNNTGVTVLTAPLTPLTQLAQQWTGLQQIFDILAGKPTNTGLDPLPQNPNTSATAGAALSPQSLSAGLLAFLSAVKSSDFSNWIGKSNIKWLQDQGQGDLLKKVEGEFQSLARQFTDAPATQHWQPLFFPVAVDGQLQQVRLYVKRDPKQTKNQQEKVNADTRFIIEIDLSKLGELQLDGFVRRDQKDLQFDMVIRSLTALPKDIQQDMLQIYNDTGAITGYKGSLTFQSVKAFPVNPMDEIAAGQNTVMA